MLLNDQYQQNNGGINTPVTQNTRNKKLIIILVIVSFVLCAIFAMFIFSQGESNDLEDKAAAAAREVIPNAEAKQVIVADGFAMAIVYVPKDESQLGAGNTSVFKVNEDGSMTYLASASYFSPIDLLEFGIPLETQAKLRETDVSNIKKELANLCDYGYYDTPGFSGFEGSFNPDGWQIDSASLEGITSVLGGVIETNNANKNYDDKVICINTELEGSDISVDETTFASTFTLKFQFITGNGVITDHLFTFSDGPVYSRIYTLDGQTLNN